eukprot:19581-Heterococcus_DN1.PRE.2
MLTSNDYDKRALCIAYSLCASDFSLLLHLGSADIVLPLPHQIDLHDPYSWLSMCAGEPQCLIPTVVLTVQRYRLNIPGDYD